MPHKKILTPVKLPTRVWVARNTMFGTCPDPTKILFGYSRWGHLKVFRCFIGDTHGLTWQVSWTISPKRRESISTD